jgi:hypothetical protein
LADWEHQSQYGKIAFVPTNRKIMQVDCFHNSMGKTQATAEGRDTGKNKILGHSRDILSDELVTNWQRMNMKSL